MVTPADLIVAYVIVNIGRRVSEDGGGERKAEEQAVELMEGGARPRRAHQHGQHRGNQEGRASREEGSSGRAQEASAGQ